MATYTNDATTIEGTAEEILTILKGMHAMAVAQEAPDTTSELSVGDVVRVLGLSRFEADFIGRVGVIESHDQLEREYVIRFDGVGRCYKRSDLAKLGGSN